MDRSPSRKDQPALLAIALAISRAILQQGCTGVNLRHSLRFNVVANLNFVAFILHSIFLYLLRKILMRCTPMLRTSRGSMPLTLRGNPVYTMDKEVRAQRAPLLPICRPRRYATRYHSQRDRLGGLRAFLAAGHPGGPHVQVQPYADTAWHPFLLCSHRMTMVSLVPDSWHVQLRNSRGLCMHLGGRGLSIAQDKLATIVPQRAQPIGN